jgi:hypothetical protein
LKPFFPAPSDFGLLCLPRRASALHHCRVQLEAATMHAARNGYRATRYGYLGTIATGAAVIFVVAIVVGLI